MAGVDAVQYSPSWRAMMMIGRVAAEIANGCRTQMLFIDTSAIQLLPLETFGNPSIDRAFITTAKGSKHEHVRESVWVLNEARAELSGSWSTLVPLLHPLAKQRTWAQGDFSNDILFLVLYVVLSCFTACFQLPCLSIVACVTNQDSWLLESALLTFGSHWSLR
jgi:hypothetical protein